MSRAIFIIGPQGSGSSAIAGALYHLGIHMGDRLKGSSLLNPKGHFECLEFDEIFSSINKENITDDNLKNVKKIFSDYIGKRNKFPIWGLKLPYISSLAKFIIPIVDECRVISIDRPAEACIKSSMLKYPNMSRDALEKIHNDIRTYRDFIIERYDLKNLYINYNDMTSNISPIMDSIVRYCFEGLDFPSKEQINTAISFVDPNLNHRREL